MKIFKIYEIFCENPRIIFVLFYDVHKENKFTIKLEASLITFTNQIHSIKLTQNVNNVQRTAGFLNIMFTRYLLQVTLYKK